MSGFSSEEFCDPDIASITVVNIFGGTLAVINSVISVYSIKILYNFLLEKKVLFPIITISSIAMFGISSILWSITTILQQQCTVTSLELLVIFGPLAVITEGFGFIFHYFSFLQRLISSFKESVFELREINSRLLHGLGYIFTFCVCMSVILLIFTDNNAENRMALTFVAASLIFYIILSILLIILFSYKLYCVWNSLDRQHKFSQSSLSNTNSMASMASMPSSKYKINSSTLTPSSPKSINITNTNSVNSGISGGGISGNVTPASVSGDSNAVSLDIADIGQEKQVQEDDKSKAYNTNDRKQDSTKPRVLIDSNSYNPDSNSNGKSRSRTSFVSVYQNEILTAINKLTVLVLVSVLSTLFTIVFIVCSVFIEIKWLFHPWVFIADMTVTISCLYMKFDFGRNVYQRVCLLCDKYVGYLCHGLHVRVVSS